MYFQTIFYPNPKGRKLFENFIKITPLRVGEIILMKFFSQIWLIKQIFIDTILSFRVFDKACFYVESAARLEWKSFFASSQVLFRLKSSGKKDWERKAD
ncbi:hypothetical protein [Epilithonimonas lactis]|uniref:Uncharacterized protein n=1 Tax=Epilithonimonas lactis TaxID=421072 RepID=A0A085BL63_9FLAO|nr:hypothetical protein [Epilithonimonas lactis]KFC23208.1 hypothetical protein IO89_01020 [Epilithonimonas lactis]SEQ05383.1 hypothetical protein SAMN04488097_1158 [Epilithonimonas lactis]